MFSLVELPYALDALEPVISARTLEFHHGKHLKGYVDNLNKLVSGSAFEEMALEDIVRTSAPSGSVPNAAVYNNAGQILNHNMYFEQFSRPVSGVEGLSGDSPVPEPISPVLERSRRAGESHLLSQIDKQWGTLDTFKAEFVAKGVGIFGSGWVWLSADIDGNLVISQEPGASNPIVRGLKPLLTFDVWEHAYYLDYQNRRADHLAALWQILDWAVIERRYDK